MNLPSLPREITAHTGTPLLIENPFQGTNFETYILHSERDRFVLKYARTPRLTAELAAEQRVLRQIRTADEEDATIRRLVPQPLEFVHHQGTGISLLTWLPGDNIVESLPVLDRGGKEQLIAATAHMLGQIHRWQPPLPRPTDWSARALARARRRVQSGSVEQPIRHAGQFRGADPQAILSELEQRLPPTTDDSVFCHGDYCLPNVLAIDGEITGIVDWSRGGYTDRRYDLATTMWSIGYNLDDPALVDLFLWEYGYREPKQELWPFQALYVLS